jgi:hypothetical protein
MRRRRGQRAQLVERAEVVRLSTAAGDGPVSEQIRQIAGFNLLECDDPDEPSKWPPRTRRQASAS